MAKKKLKVISKEEFFRQIDAITEKRRKIKKQIEDIDADIGSLIQEQIIGGFEDEPHRKHVRRADKIKRLEDRRKKFQEKLK